MSATFSNQVLALIFNGTAITGLAQNTTSSPYTSLYIALHTADPTGGTQSTSEIAYTGYARVAVTRTSGGFVVTSNVLNPAANIVFPTGSGGSGTATFMSIGVNATGATELLWSGGIAPSIVCGSGVTPTLTTATSLTQT